MPERDIVVTEDDARKFRTLLVGVRERSVRDREHFQQLDDELDRARVIPASEIPADATFEASEFLLEGDTVVVFGGESGTVRATGEPFRNEWCQKYVVSANQIARMVEYNIQVEPR